MRCVQPLALQKAPPNHAWTRITPDALVLLTTSTLRRRSRSVFVKALAPLALWCKEPKQRSARTRTAPLVLCLRRVAILLVRALLRGGDHCAPKTDKPRVEPQKTYETEKTV